MWQWNVVHSQYWLSFLTWGQWATLKPKHPPLCPYMALFHWWKTNIRLSFLKISIIYESLPTPPIDLKCPADARAIFMRKTPIKIQFPCYGRRGGGPDPLRYMEKCGDYLALYHLQDDEIIATLWNVLYGPAREWWDVAHECGLTPWLESETPTLSVFLSED